MEKPAVIIVPERPAEAAVPPASAEHPDLTLSCSCNSGCGVWCLADESGHLATMWRPGGWFWTAARGVIRT